MRSITFWNLRTGFGSRVLGRDEIVDTKRTVGRTQFGRNRHGFELLLWDKLLLFLEETTGHWSIRQIVAIQSGING